MVMKHLEHAPIVINGRTFPMSELGDIAKMGIVEGFQAMMDRGFFGEYPPGTNFFDVVGIHGVDTRLVEPSDEEKERYLEVCDLLEAARQLEAQGLDATEARRAYSRALRDHDMLTKLSRP